VAAIPLIDKLADHPALSTIALFLDVDGTLLEIAAAPQSVSVPDDLRELLRALSLAGGGGVALVSGRSIAALDALFAPLTLPSAGLHGFERRSASGAYLRKPPPSGAALEVAHEAMSHLARRHPGLLVEDKRFALALHYRGAPHLESTVVELMQGIAASLAGQLELQRGKMVVELRPAGTTKANAVSDFLGEAPFAGRVPIFIGDDLTDESAFDFVNRREGLSVIVDGGRPSAARARLADVAAVRGWLAELHADTAAALQRLSDSTHRASARDREGSAAEPRGIQLRSQL
jgi:trehalose 6-phosphate phosphatase